VLLSLPFLPSDGDDDDDDDDKDNDPPSKNIPAKKPRCPVCKRDVEGFDSKVSECYDVVISLLEF